MNSRVSLLFGTFNTNDSVPAVSKSRSQLGSMSILIAPSAGPGSTCARLSDGLLGPGSVDLGSGAIVPVFGGSVADFGSVFGSVAVFGSAVTVLALPESSFDNSAVRLAEEPGFFGAAEPLPPLPTGSVPPPPVSDVHDASNKTAAPALTLDQ